MIAAAYIEAVYQEPPIILGLQLRPFTAGHRLLLEKFVAFDGSSGQLALAVLICAQSHDAALADLQSPDLPRTMARFAQRLRWVGRWPFRKRRVIDLPAEWARFTAWFQQSMEFPPVKFDSLRSDPKSPQSGAHFVLAVWLHARKGMTWAEFLDHPWRMVLWEVAAAKEMEGDLQILTPEAVASLSAAQAEADAFDARIRAEDAARKEAPNGVQ